MWTHNITLRPGRLREAAKWKLSLFGGSCTSGEANAVKAGKRKTIKQGSKKLVPATVVRLPESDDEEMKLFILRAGRGIYRCNT